MSARPFELELLGGGVERRYRRERPEVLAMPWGSLASLELEEASRVIARGVFTRMAFFEHATARACVELVGALLDARAPIDLVAVASAFPADEMVHAELCARVAMELGGGTEIVDGDRPPRVASNARPLARLAERALVDFCIGEAFAFVVLRENARLATHPLARAVFRALVHDEAAHGAVGFLVLDWALPELGRDERAHLAGIARDAIDAVRASWPAIVGGDRLGDDEARALGLIAPDRYVELARAKLEDAVIAPLRARGLDVGPTLTR